MDSKEYFGSDIEVIRKKQWDWSTFTSTKGFPVSDKLLDWIVGQEHAMKECYLCLDEWLYKLKYLQKAKWYKPWLDPFNDKPTVKQILTPGPYLLLLGDPGTGKSLIGRAMAEKLTQLYKKHKIKLFDVLSWPNPIIPGEPRISIHEAGKGKEVVRGEGSKGKRKSWLGKWGIKALCGLIVGLGFTFLLLSGYWISKYLNAGFDVPAAITANAQLLMIGGSMTMAGFMIFFFSRMFSNLSGMQSQGIGGATSSKSPKLLVNNSDKIAKFIDATGHTSAQLFGSLIWDPYQSGNLSTPEHQRITVGDVHKAHLGIIYIDEIKNLHPQEAITLLSVLEDGQLPVTMRSTTHGGDTSAMAISTEPIPSMIFLVGAGNFDSINQLHPALMDRIVGYGKVVRMSNDMPNTLANRKKYIQFISQEANRFHLPPFSKDACIEIVNEGRRRSNKRDCLTTKFRPLISVIKTAGTLAQNAKSTLVEANHVIEAINEHCKTIQKQLLEHHIQEQGRFMEIEPKGNMLGSIYGLAVSSDEYSGEMTGSVLRVKAQLIKRSPKDSRKGYYTVTGIAKDSKWIKASVDKVRSVILKKYNVDIAQDYFTHIDFSQAYGIDGPSAGVTMAILLCSLIEGKPIKQDVCVTGEINISSTDDIAITAIGGVHEKLKAAESWNFDKVVIPHKNLKHSIDPKDYKIKIVGAKTLEEYLKETLVNSDSIN